ncbi:bifunctional RNase H/acid phosphatase [Streptomyces sp. HP-A2021]|uniref:bifunctional RNase H/acid phosphatase n=1 Tax=Streptomyces sp. HP-A2021 TaxID=2927875 RepID=UPI001FB02B76|nr:bifunctional RNase H/acid phosphatase [Streptomyces sp. HP-A2021]UOB13280.1 bifunctional RNase H/acid phosphatase [Streptomyces sp. HP-A2021]
MREFIVEADGGSRGNPGPAGYGAVVSDAATGETLREAAEYLGVATNNVAEYRGLLAGLRAAHELDPAATVHVRMDSKLVVEQMSGRWKIKHPDMKPLAADAARIFPPGRVTYEWIPRERNKHADRLANEAMDAGARGEQWSASTSTADLDTPAATVAPPDPPGDATAGAARAREALAAGRTPESGSSSPAPSSAPGTTEQSDAGVSAAKADADARAAKAVASPGWAPADMGAPATFVLLRHGETPLTPQKRFSGSGGTDPALSDIGRDQAERAAALLARRGTIQAIVSSPLARTRETAGIVAARLGLDVGVDDGLRETDFGAWEGLTFAEVRERHPDDLNSWLASPDAEPTGGGESFAATATRIAATRDKLVAAYAGRTVLLVTHVTPIKTLVRLALGAPPESLFRMELSAASLSVVAYYADGNASVRLLNDTSHLR